MDHSRLRGLTLLTALAAAVSTSCAEPGSAVAPAPSSVETAAPGAGGGGTTTTKATGGGRESGAPVVPGGQDPAPAEGDAPPCAPGQVEAELVPGERTGSGNWSTWVHLVSKGGKRCSVTGVGGIRLIAGGNGASLPFQQVTAEDAEVVAVPLSPGYMAGMRIEYPTTEATGASVPPDCVEGLGFVQVLLPGHEDTPVDAKPHTPEAPANNHPPVCGAVQTSAWFLMD